MADIEEVRPKVTQHMPEVLVGQPYPSFWYNPNQCKKADFLLLFFQFSASMWSDEQAQEIHQIAREVNPNIKLHALPPGLQVERGPDAVVEYLCEKVPILLKN